MPAGLVALGEQFRYNTLVDIDLDVDPEAASDLSPEHGAELLQLVREALSNAARHSQARHLVVTFSLREEGAVLIVADDGVGFDASAPIAPGHQGLGNMQARAEAIGATIRVESAKGEGTRIIVLVPPRAAPIA